MYPGGGHPAHRGRIRHEDRVYPDQRSQFENGELFRKLTRESEVNNLQPSPAKTLMIELFTILILAAI